MSWRDRAKKVEGGSSWRDRSKNIETSEPLVIQQMHPSISKLDRAKIKNLANSPEDAIGYLRNAYPGLEVGMRNNQIVVKDKSDKDFKVVDPDTGFFSSDILNDAIDIAYDVPAMVAEGAGTIAGGLAGFAGGGGIGAIPGAMAGGAASGAATEGIKQALGKYLGVNNNFDTNSVVVNSALSGVSPLAFGVGAVSAKAAAKKGINKLAFDEAGRGGIQRGFGFVGNKIGTALTGVPEEIIKYYSKYMSKVDGLNEEKKFKILKGLRDKTLGAINQKRQSVGKKIGSTYDNLLENDLAGELRFPVERVKEAPLLDLLSKREAAQRTNNPAIKQAYQRARAQYLNTFKGMDDAVGSDLVYLKDSLKDTSRAYKMPGVRFSGKEGPADKTLANAYAGAFGSFNDVADDFADGALKPLNKQYKNIIDDEKLASKILRDEESADRLLRNLGKNTKDVARQKIRGLDAKYGTGLERNAKRLNAYEYFNNPGLTPISSGGSTSTSRSMLGKSLGGAAGYFAGSESGGDKLMSGGAGAALGIGLASPYFLKQFLKSKRATGVLADQLVPTGVRRSIYGDLLENTFD